jgi:hypothetical protein
LLNAAVIPGRSGPDTVTITKSLFSSMQLS